MNGEMTDGPGERRWGSMMLAAIAGDEATYRQLLEEISRAVRSMARRAFLRARIGDADIEDVVQETLLAIHLKRHTWDGGLPLAPWVNAIARHKIIDAMRRRSALRSDPIEDFEAGLAAPEEPDPHARSDIERVLQKLAPRQREIVSAISLEGQSIAATAARLSMTEVAVRVALHRALKALAVAWRSATQ
jgi:RNA polymerase sigma-70 factor, ECF subfamily